MRRSGGLAELAEALQMDPKDVQDWLNDDKKRFRVAANFQLLDRMPEPKKKKPGPQVEPISADQKRRIRKIGAHRHARKLLEERKKSMG